MWYAFFFLLKRRVSKKQRFVGRFIYGSTRERKNKGSILWPHENSRLWRKLSTVTVNLKKQAAIHPSLLVATSSKIDWFPPIVNYHTIKYKLKSSRDRCSVVTCVFRWLRWWSPRTFLIMLATNLYTFPQEALWWKSFVIGWFWQFRWRAQAPSRVCPQFPGKSFNYFF